MLIKLNNKNKKGAISKRIIKKLTFVKYVTKSSNYRSTHQNQFLFNHE